MDILLIGSSGHAKVIIDIVRCQGTYTVRGLLDDQRAKGERTMDVPVLGRIDELPAIMRTTGIEHGIIAVGDNDARMHIAERIKQLATQFHFVTAVHPRATIASDVVLGAGTVVMAGVTVNPSVVVGAHCILNTNCSIDHDRLLGDCVSVAPGANLGGGGSFGNGSAVGMNACVLQKVNIGRHCVIGAGAVVLQDVPDLHVAVGVPAKCVRTRRIGEPYL